MATMMNERYAIEEGEEEDDVSYTSFKTISTIKTSDGEQTICEEQHNTAFTSYQTISTVRTWNEEDDTQAEDSTESPCVSHSSVISTCRKGVTSHDYYSGLSLKRSKVDESFFNLNQMNGTFQVLMDVEEHISGSSCGSCPDPSLKQARDPMTIKENRNEKLQVSISPKTAQRRLQQLTASALVSPTKVPARRGIQKGDRIEALQRLVSPFGKADTASVLMESIEYIKFLQQQIQVLLNRKDGGDIEIDLKSRGFCLVPIEYTIPIAQVNYVPRE